MLFMVFLLSVLHNRWLSDIMVGCRTYNREVVGSSPSRVAVELLLLGWVTVCGQVNHPGI